MLKMRARGFSLRDTFTDALKGVMIAEELVGDEDADFRVVNEPPPAPPAAEKLQKPHEVGTAEAVEAASSTQNTQSAATESRVAAPDAGAQGSPAASASAPSEEDADVETPEETLAKLDESLSFCATEETVEEGYAALDPEAVLADVEGGVERARDIKLKHLERVTPNIPVDPFASPGQFKDEEAFKLFVNEAIKATTSENVKKLEEAWNNSVDAGAKAASKQTMTELKKAVAAKVAEFASPKDASPGPQGASGAASAPEQSSAPAKPSVPAGDPRTVEEYDAWLNNLLATAKTSQEITKAWINSTDVKDALNPPPSEEQRRIWKVRKEKRCTELRGE
jgi:hypothetical protein